MARTAMGVVDMSNTNNNNNPPPRPPNSRTKDFFASPALSLSLPLRLLEILKIRESRGVNSVTFSQKDTQGSRNFSDVMRISRYAYMAENTMEHEYTKISAGIFRDGAAAAAAAAAANMEVEEGEEGSGGGGRREETVEISSENSGHARSRSEELDFDGADGEDEEGDGGDGDGGDKNKKKKRKKYHRHTAEQIREMEA